MDAFYAALSFIRVFRVENHDTYQDTLFRIV